MDISFSGAGFMGCYYFGVVDCWSKYIPRERVNRVAGTSAGSLIAVCYVLNLQLEEPLREVITLLESFRVLTLGVFDRRGGQIVHLLPKLLDRVLPDDAHKQVSGKLFVCMTRLKDMKRVVASEFETKKDLIDALNCSCFIPVWSGNSLPTYKGVKHMDGGFKDNLVTFDEHTIRICCFSGSSDIAPCDRAKMNSLAFTLNNMPVNVNFSNVRRFKKALSPPTPNYVIDLLDRGYHDTKIFILDNDLIQCDKCFSKIDLMDHPIFSSLSPPTLTSSTSPGLSRAGSYRKLNQTANGDIFSREQEKQTNLLRPSIDRNNNRASFRSSSFNNLLAEKLDQARSPSRSSGFFSSSEDENLDTIKTTDGPIIVVEDLTKSDEGLDKVCINREGNLTNIQHLNHSSSLSSSSSEESKVKRTVPFGSEKLLAKRRSSAALQSGLDDNRLLVLEEKFKLAPNPLPSCPPSPNLNRHCTECLRLRQQARADILNEDLARVAQEFQPNNNMSKVESKLKMKLSSPIRWIRQLGVKSSYQISDA